MNDGWSIAFFGAHSPRAGLFVIVPFLLLIVTTGFVFGKVDASAGWLLTPYVAWVTFALVLNVAIERLN